MVVRKLELALDAFEGPFDLLLTLVLREELDLAEIDVAAIVIAFIERLAEREELDLEACGEFLVLVAALLELKARALFPDEEAELAELGPEEAAEELARRLAEYRRMKEAAGWLSERLGRDARPLLPPRPCAGGPAARAEARAAGGRESRSPRRCGRSRSCRRRCRSRTWRCASRRWRCSSNDSARCSGKRRFFDFDQEVGRHVPRVEIAVAFLALLELRKQGEIAIQQAAPRSRR